MSEDAPPPFEPSRQLIEAASWRLVCELCRRHPGFQVVETHPGGGLYDCLDMFFAGDKPPVRPRISINRAGSLHFFAASPSWKQWETFWQDYLGASDPREILNRVCLSADLTIPAHLPATTPRVIVFRFIAAFLSQTVLGKTKWECRNGYFDSSGPEGSERAKQWFRLFPAAQIASERKEAPDVLGVPAYRFWFLCQERPP